MAAGEQGPGPTRAVEIERKYDVDPDTPLPVWEGTPGVVRVTSGELRQLDARYLDTADMLLARSGVALRRRTGGPDEGWHVKGPRTGEGRVELGWPLGDGDAVPAAVAEVISAWTTEELFPLARIENARVAYHLIGVGGVVAEFVDDHVRATDLRTGVQREWREWELELGPAAPSSLQERLVFFAGAERAIFATGAREPSTGSKLARALGY